MRARTHAREVTPRAARVSGLLREINRSPHTLDLPLPTHTHTPISGQVIVQGCGQASSSAAKSIPILAIDGGGRGCSSCRLRTHLRTEDRPTGNDFLLIFLQLIRSFQDDDGGRWWWGGGGCAREPPQIHHLPDLSGSAHSGADLA